MITTEDNMRRLLILFLLFSAAFVGARERSALVVRSFPFTHSGYLDVNHGGAATMWIDFSQDPSGATITTSDGGYTLTKAGAPARVNDGTWPAGLSGAQGYAHDLNGVDDEWYRADTGAGDAFEPSGSFSVRCALTAHDVSGSQDIIGKWTALGSQRGWKLYLSTTTVGLGVSDDGTTDAGHVSYASKAAAVSKFVPAFITASYQYVADGSSVGNVYVNNLSTGSNSSMDGPAFDNTSNFEIGSGSGNFFNGLIHHCAYYDGVVLTEADHDFAFAQWQGRMSTTGNVATVTSAAPPDVIMAPPASGTEPFIVPQPANASYIGSPAAGSGGAYGASGITNLAYRSRICWTQTGGNEPQGWGSVETAGDGSADISCSTDYAANGLYSAKTVLTGTTSYASIRTACITTGIGSDIYLSAYQMCASGTCTSQLRVLEYDAADCTSYLADTLVIGTVGTTAWAKFGGTFASGSWNGSTSSYKVHLFDSGDSGTTTYWSAPMVRVASQPHDGFCGNDADSAAVCNDVVYTIANPLTSGGTWEITGTTRTPIDWARQGRPACS